MKKISIKVINIILSIILIILGCIVVCYSHKNFNIISSVLGLAVIVRGILFFTIYEKLIKNYKLQDIMYIVFGILSIIFGILLISKSTLLNSVIIYITAIWFIMVSIFDFNLSVFYEYKGRAYYLNLFINILVFGLAIMLLFIQKSNFNVLVGIIFIVDALKSFTFYFH
ncbi:DUF308 domain-containing protein [Peptoniphilus stercorisuis]|uniref:Uncharacterized membrane protein HdeD (DUF308 family) n=1 Tax=Peptoniphilus stercorisuis TaxID=1436965 RepID=A0ABS4KDQ9_9FIRM|nr:DUF308 domain-containing protein [Peptoniphilus stercorisuis]MBP2025904.1 uncharacterized membrane protein HdeD (DUF308 family) [Peptoniphilus stercorisuis]